jgi:hypothetical protein
MSTSTTAGTTGSAERVDARLPRFIATLTATVLATALLVAAVSPPAAAVILAGQAAVFAVGAARGPRRHPYRMLFGRLVAPRIGPAAHDDPVPQFRFAQLIGALLATLGAAGFALGVPFVGALAAGFALFAAFLRSAFGICLSRRPYLLVSRMRGNVPACCQNK